MIPISMHSNIFFILKKKTPQDYFSLQLLSLSLFFFPFTVKFLKSCLYYFFFPFTPFILELLHIRFCSHHFTYQYGWVAKSRGDCSCKVLFYWISSFFQPLNNAVSWASDSLTLPCQSPPVSWLCIPIFRMMTPKLISHLSLRSSLQFPLGCLKDVTNLTRLKQNSSCPVLSDPNCFSHSLPCLIAVPFF